MTNPAKLHLSPKPSRRRSLTSEVIDSLRKAIVEGELASGAKLPTEQELAKQMDVSRTVVREAVAALKADGLVKTRQGVGVFVIGQGEVNQFRVDPEKLESIENVLDLLDLRIALETDMAGLAAERRTAGDLERLRACLEKINTLMEQNEDSVDADFEFHLAIAKATQNEYFVSFVRFMGTKTVPARDLLVAPPQGAAYVALINSEHSAIVDAIASQDIERARISARSHLLNSRSRHAAKAGL